MVKKNQKAKKSNRKILITGILIFFIIILSFFIIPFFQKLWFISHIDPDNFEITIKNENGFAGWSQSIVVDSELNGQIFLNENLVKNGTIKSENKESIWKLLKKNYPFDIYRFYSFFVTDRTIIEVNIISGDFLKDVRDIKKDEFYMKIWALSGDLKPVLSPAEVLDICMLEEESGKYPKTVCLSNYALAMRNISYCNEEETDYKYSCTQVVKKWISLGWY